MKLWLTRDEDGDWQSWYDEPQLRQADRSRYENEKRVTYTEGEYTCDAGFGSSYAEKLAEVLGVELQPGDKVLVEVHGGILRVGDPVLGDVDDE